MLFRSIKKSLPEPGPAEIVPHALYLSPEHRTFVHDGRLVGLKAFNVPPSGVYNGSMPFQTPAVPVPTFLERLGHSLLINNQVGDHFLHAAHPLLEFLVFLGHGFPL